MSECEKLADICCEIIDHAGKVLRLFEIWNTENEPWTGKQIAQSEIAELWVIRGVAAAIIAAIEGGRRIPLIWKWKLQFSDWEVIREIYSAERSA